MNKTVKYVSISPEEVEAIYRCISFSMDLRDNIEWNNEDQYWSEYDWLSKNIGIALMAAHKLAGYETGINK
jgi:hypothetical protein